MEPKKIKSLGKDVNSYIFSLKVVLKSKYLPFLIVFVLLFFFVI
uniref:Uncharacterized protein n=1 Tax=Mus musculus TaxID=10090 RepID=Q3TD29_MOUSE|nr:unnamed protein product [Mus musculus]